MLRLKEAGRDRQEIHPLYQSEGPATAARLEVEAEPEAKGETMIWLNLIIALIPLILELIKWLQNRNSLNDRQKAKFNELIFHIERLRGLAVARGCKPKGELPDDE